MCYLKNRSARVEFNKIALTGKARKEYRYKDEVGYFRRGTIVDNSRGKHIITIQAPNGVKKTIKSIRTLEFIEEQQAKNLVYWTKSGTPYLKIYLDSSQGQVSSNWFDDVGVNEDASECLTGMGLNFSFSKPYTLVENILQIAASADAIILDSFAGSGTTAHAVLNQNRADGGSRRFILIEMMDYADELTARRVKRVIDGCGEDEAAVEGTGGDFSFYELGEPLLVGGSLNRSVDVEKIRAYVYFTETRQRLGPAKEDEPYFLGAYLGTGYYFYYEREQVTTLSREFLHTGKTRAGAYVMYADLCTLSDRELEQYHITFKKISRDIARL